MDDNQSNDAVAKKLSDDLNRRRFTEDMARGLGITPEELGKRVQELFRDWASRQKR